MRRLALAAIIAWVATGCSSDSYRLELSKVAASYTVGDTLRLTATEWIQRPFETEDQTTDSNRDPAAFGWLTSDPEVAQVLKPGVVLMRAAGTTTLRVRTYHASATVPLVVVPAADLQPWLTDSRSSGSSSSN